MKKPLPQFNSLDEAKAFYSKYGSLTPHGRIGQNYECMLYTYKVKDGRLMRLKLYDDGRVEELEIPK